MNRLKKTCAYLPAQAGGQLFSRKVASRYQ
jgi:hypothetical protein